MIHLKKPHTYLKIALILISVFVVVLVLINSFNLRNITVPPSTNKNLIINIADKQKGKYYLKTDKDS